MDCDCCTGTQSLTPQPTVNRPGLDTLAVRIGTQAGFLETMKARLSAADLPALARLVTREPSDFAIALLDGWATIADVLTFYQERWVNEGYLRTATERRSVLELARLIGYEPRPGVAASVHLAFTIDADRSVTPPKSITALVPAGTRVQSIPGPGETAQSFETSEKIEARTEWNNLAPRTTRPQTAAELQATLTPRIFLQGTSTNLRPNDPVMLVLPNISPLPMRVTDVRPDQAAGRTEVGLRHWRTAEQVVEAVGSAADYLSKVPKVVAGGPANATVNKTVTLLKDLAHAALKATPDEMLRILNKDVLPGIKPATAGDEAEKVWLTKSLAQMQEARDILLVLLSKKKESDDKPGLNPKNLLSALKMRPSQPPANALQLPRDPAGLLAANADLGPRLLAATSPELADTLFAGLSAWQVSERESIHLYALRATVPLFGHNASPRPLTFARGAVTSTGEWPLIEPDADPRKEHEISDILNLEGNLDKLAPDSLLVVQTARTPLTPPRVQTFRAGAVTAALSRADYGLSGSITKVALQSWSSEQTATWIDIDSPSAHPDDIEALRQTVVFAQSEELPLAEEPITTPIGACGDADGGATEIELDGLYDGLDPGRWLILTGERLIRGTSGVLGGELVMLAGVSHRVDGNLPGDKLHTYLTLSAGLAYCYLRETVVIYGNVAKATHGETRREVLGSGDAVQAMQQFDLRQPPLTFVSAPTPSGIRSTLRVRVNDVEWHEADSLEGLRPTDCRFVTRIDDDGTTTVLFGNGQSGRRPPTGSANIRADYRNGIGQAGNARAEQIALLSSRPLGVQGVINPLRASGGADRETRDEARANAPLAVQALDRLVSVQAYADFARTFAGIGKASARRVSDGGRILIHLTIAGAGDIPIDEQSDLFRNLKQALGDFGDQALPVKLAARELLTLSLAARVRVQADYEWETVEPRVRAALLEAFSFGRRALGQGVANSEVIAVIQRVRGVEYVDLDALTGLDPAVIAQQVSAALGGPAAAALLQNDFGVKARLARPNPDPGDPRILPAQLAILIPGAPATLRLSEISA
jgi:hypothetical protein